MNTERRKEIAEAVYWIRKGLDALEGAKDGEQESYDNMPESLQQGDKGQDTEAMASMLSEQWDNIDIAVNELEGIDGLPQWNPPTPEQKFN